MSTYLVPFDFTPVTVAALNYALFLAESADDNIVLMHVVKKQSDQHEAEMRLQKVIDGLSSALQARVSAKAVVGDVFEDIGKVGSVVDAQLIVMGTHGMHGMQKVFGSHAIKVITHSAIPFVILQGEVREPTVSRIVMPFDLSKESIQIVQFATKVAKHFKAEIHMLGGQQEDEWLKNKSASNIRYATSHFKENGVAHKVELLPRTRGFNEEVMRYARENDADMIAVGYFKESLLPQFTTFVQSLITNDQGIPVLAINADEILTVNSQFTFLTI